MKYLKPLSFILFGAVAAILLTKALPVGLGKSAKSEFFYPVGAPQLLESRLSSGVSCESISSTILVVSEESNSKTIEAEILTGTDKLSVRLDKDKLYFLTQAAQGAGATEGDALDVKQNTGDYLTAIFLDQFGGIDTFVLNKKTGKAIWSKNHSQYPPSGNDAENQSMMLNCL